MGFFLLVLVLAAFRRAADESFPLREVGEDLSLHFLSSRDTHKKRGAVLFTDVRRSNKA